MIFTFSKSEKLCKRSDIDHVFRKGKVLYEQPFKLIYHIKEEEELPLKVGFSVPKKKFKKAVDRNLLKRRMREAFRLQDAELKQSLKNKKVSAHVFFIYLSDQKLQYREIEDKIMLLLQRLQKINEEDSQ